MGITADLQATVQGILADVAGANGLVPLTVYLWSHSVTESPGTAPVPTNTLQGTYPGLSLQQLTADQVRREYGTDTGEAYRIKIALPATLPQAGWYAAIDATDTAQQIVGKVSRVDPKLSALVELTVRADVASPLSFAEAIAL